MKKIAVIGAGVGGLAAAYDLALSGCDVTIFEKESFPGGLASGFKKESWEWSLEKYYHHWFEKDKAVLSLINELGLMDKVVFHRPKTVVFYQEDFHQLDSPVAALKYPGFSFIDKTRFGLVTVFLKYLAGWKPLEQSTAHNWMRKYYGPAIYKQLFEPLLIGKFSSFYQEVNMAWFWARFKARSTRLGTYHGGFQSFLDDFVDILVSKGVHFRYDISISKIFPADHKKLNLKIGNQKETFDQVLATVAPKILANLTPAIGEEYREKINRLKSIGAVMLIFSLKHPLSKEKYYWYNLPKSAGFPFLAYVEHTNFVSKKHFNDEHLAYCGDYLEPTHEYFSLTKNQLIDRFIPGLKRINPNFKSTWINGTWLYRTSFAQPVPPINHSENILDIRTPVENLYLASMSQVYPWDRGTNFAVELARKAIGSMKIDW